MKLLSQMEMKSIILFMFLLQAIINGVNLAMAQPPSPGQVHRCQTVKHESNIQRTNRDAALDEVSKNLRQQKYIGFRDAHVGERNFEKRRDRNDTFAWILCPPNIQVESCEECVKKTVPFLKQNCADRKKGVAWTLLSDKISCMVQYANHNPDFYETVWAQVTFSNPKKGANVNELEKGVNNLANKLRAPTIGKGVGVEIKFASGNVTYGPGSSTLYGSMQCLPFLQKDTCEKCLIAATNEIHTCCTKNGKMSARVMSTQCYFRYAHENYLTMNSPATSAP